VPGWPSGAGAGTAAGVTYQKGYMQSLGPETRLFLVAHNHVHVMLHARQDPVEALHAQRFAANEMEKANTVTLHSDTQLVKFET